MLVKQELVSKIKDYFNLNIYETKVWLALLGKGIASAGEIADASGVPRSRTYDVLEGLDKKGFAIVKIGKPVKYIGVKPHIILEKLKNDVKKDAEQRINDLLKIRSTDEFMGLEDLYKSGVDPIKREDISAALKGKTNISSYLREILQNAKKEVIICSNAEEITSKMSLFRQTFKILKGANIKIKIALSGDDALIKKIGTELEVKIKKININTKFFIIDRREFLFYLSNNNEKEDIALWLNSEFFTQAFAALFEQATKGK